MERKKPESTSEDKVELRPDGWDRFVRAVDIAARTPAVHRTKPPATTTSVIKTQRKP